MEEYHKLVASDSGESEKEVVLVNSKHSLKEKQFSNPSFCVVCNQFIW